MASLDEYEAWLCVEDGEVMLSEDDVCPVCNITFEEASD